MNYVKKLLNKKSIYLFLIMLILILFTILILLQIRNSKKIIFLIEQENYSYVKNEKIPLSFNINCSRQDTMHFEKDVINKCLFCDYDNDDSYVVELIEIIKSNDEIKYENEKYFSYNLKFNLPFSSSELIKIKKFYLTIEYVNDEKISLPMGSLSVASSKYNESDIIISSMQGIVNEMNNQDILVGIMIKPKMISEDIEIINIETVSSIAKLNIGETKEINGDIKNDQLIDEIIGKNYNIYDNNISSKFNLSIESNKQYIIPLSYSKVESINTLSFIVEYLKNNETVKQVIYPFKFYSNNKSNQMKKVIYG